MAGYCQFSVTPVRMLSISMLCTRLPQVPPADLAPSRVVNPLTDLIGDQWFVIGAVEQAFRELPRYSVRELR